MIVVTYARAGKRRQCYLDGTTAHRYYHLANVRMWYEYIHASRQDLLMLATAVLFNDTLFARD